jgi:hypothetical protein
MYNTYLFWASVLLDEEGYPITPSTVSVIDMAYLDLVVSRSNDLAESIYNSSLALRSQIWNALASKDSDLQRFNEDAWPYITLADKLVDLYHLAEIVREFPEIQQEADNLLATKNQFIVKNAYWSGWPKPDEVIEEWLDNQWDIYWDHENSNGVTITFPFNPISFYTGEWLDFAQGTDWAFLNRSGSIQTDNSTDFYWGKMISLMIEENNPNGEDQPNPPDAVEIYTPIKSVFESYFPIVIH